MSFKLSTINLLVIFSTLVVVTVILGFIGKRIFGAGKKVVEQTVEDLLEEELIELENLPEIESTFTEQEPEPVNEIEQEPEPVNEIEQEPEPVNETEQEQEQVTETEQEQENNYNENGGIYNINNSGGWNNSNGWNNTGGMDSSFRYNIGGGYTAGERGYNPIPNPGSNTNNNQVETTSSIVISTSSGTLTTTSTIPDTATTASTPSAGTVTTAVTTASTSSTGNVTSSATTPSFDSHTKIIDGNLISNEDGTIFTHEIEGSNDLIYSIDKLNNITHITGELIFTITSENNDSVNFNNLEEVGKLMIYTSSNIETISGKFNKLKRIYGDTYMRGLYIISSSITRIGNCFNDLEYTEGLTLTTPNLTFMSPFHNLTTITHFFNLQKDEDTGKMINKFLEISHFPELVCIPSDELEGFTSIVNLLTDSGVKRQPLGKCSTIQQTTTSTTTQDTVECSSRGSQLPDGSYECCNGAANIRIPDGVTSIGNYAFELCTSLKLVVIPDSVTSIGDYAFYRCTSLASVEIGNSVTSIGDYAFELCTSLKLVVIPDSVTSIGDQAFYRCTSLASVEIGNSVTSIGDYAFAECTGLASVVIPDSVTSIGVSVFSLCSNLASVVFGNNVTSIGDYAFAGCTSLESVVIPDSVTSIGTSAFEGSALNSITIPINKLQLLLKVGLDNIQGIDGMITDYINRGLEASLTKITITYDNNTELWVKDSTPEGITPSIVVTSSSGTSTTTSTTTTTTTSSTSTITNPIKTAPNTGISIDTNRTVMPVQVISSDTLSNLKKVTSNTSVNLKQKLETSSNLKKSISNTLVNLNQKEETSPLKNGFNMSLKNNTLKHHEATTILENDMRVVS
jgi:hypothetical protein